MHFRIPLPWGTLKIKTEKYLRPSEREGKYGIYRLGSVYLIWVPFLLP